MNAMLLPRSVLALGLGSMLCAQAPKPVARTVEDVLPASTYAVARFGGLEACRESAGAVPMSAIVNAFLAKIPAETRSQYFEKGLDDAAEHVQGFLQHLGVGAADLRAVLSCPMAIAMGRLTIEGRGPSVALVMDAGDRQAAVERVIAILCHIASRALVLLAVARRRWALFWCGFALLSGVDALATYFWITGLVRTMSPWLMETLLVPFALASIPITIWCVREWPEESVGQSPTDS